MQPNLDFSFRGLNHCSNPIYIWSLWDLIPGRQDFSIFPNFEVNLQKYIRNLISVDNGRTLFGPSTSLHRKNCRGVWPVVRLTAIWNCAFHHMEHPQLWSHLSPYPQREIDWFLRKKVLAGLSEYDTEVFAVQSGIKILCFRNSMYLSLSYLVS
jgi:hypothetical protein